MATEILKDFYIGVLSRLCVTYSKIILVALKAAVDRNFNSHRLQDSGSSKSDGYRVKKVVNPPGKKKAKCEGATFLTVCGRPICEGEWCNSLCDGSKSEGNESYKKLWKLWLSDSWKRKRV